VFQKKGLQLFVETLTVSVPNQDNLSNFFEDFEMLKSLF